MGPYTPSRSVVMVSPHYPSVIGQSWRVWWDPTNGRTHRHRRGGDAHPDDQVGPASMRPRTSAVVAPGGRSHMAHVAPSAAKGARSWPGCVATAMSKPARW